MKVNWNKGFSLVEVLLAAALMGGLALTLAKLNQDQMKSTKTVETKFEYTAVLNEMRQILGSNDSCKATLQGRDATNTLPNTTITKIVKQTPSGPIDRFIANPTGNGPAYGNGLVRIVSFSLSSAVAPAGMHPGEQTGTTHLTVTFNFGAKERTYISSVTKTILLNVDTVDASDRTITDCSASGSTASEFVKRSGDSMYGNLIMEDGYYIELQSDKRLKYDVKNVKDSISQINKLRPVSYKWKSHDKFDYGFLAQEVQTVYPTLVKENEQGYLSVNYIQLIPHLVKSIQTLDAENKLLKKELKTMKAEQSLMKRQLESADHKKD